MKRNQIATFAMACSACGLVFVSAPGLSAGYAAATQDQTAVAPEAALLGRLRTEVTGLGPAASTEDLEASIIFVLGQQSYAPTVIDSALGGLSAGASPALQQAIANVRAALLRRKLRRGTSALGGGAFGGQSSSFSTPVVTVGGGTSNYAQ